MKKRTKIAIVFSLGLAFLPVACLVPIPRQTVVYPALWVQVLQKETQQPLQKERVTLFRKRLGPPPKIISHSISFWSQADGIIVQKAVSRREWIFPLMIHGVSFWSYWVRVEKQGFQTIEKRLDWEVGSPQKWIVELSPYHSVFSSTRRFDYLML